MTAEEPQKWKPLTLKIQPGRIRVTAGDIMQSGPGIAALSIDLHSKYAEIGGIGFGGPECLPCVNLCAGVNTLHVDKAQPEYASTVVEFQDFPGWSVHSVWIGRDTLSVCLVSPEPTP